MIQKKICILGASGVGKTSLTRQFVDGIFSEKYLTTIGVKIDKKTVATAKEDVQLMIWDIEGIDRYCGFNPRYLRGASVFVIVMDQTRAQSLVEGMEILEMAREHTDVPAVMVVNKCDLDTQWHWREESVIGYATAFDAYFRTSAKTGEHVDAMFDKVALLSQPA
jgi:small GTP-binding protein